MVCEATYHGAIVAKMELELRIFCRQKGPVDLLSKALRSVPFSSVSSLSSVDTSGGGGGRGVISTYHLTGTCNFT